MEESWPVNSSETDGKAYQLIVPVEGMTDQ